MDLAHINTNLLVALDLLLEEESVSRAASRQGVTASAMSHSLRALRSLFDDPILTRTREGMRPTPLAERLRGPLRRALRDLERAVASGVEFEPSTAERSFIIMAPDFITTLLLPAVTAIVSQEAPGIDLEVRPSLRRGHSLALVDLGLLESGDIDLFLGGAARDVLEIENDWLYDERFVCLVRRDHPEVADPLDLETYTRLPHALVTISDERSGTWVDEALAARGLSRRIAVRTRYFNHVPFIAAQTDLLLTCPYQLARFYADRLPLRILEPPLELPPYAEYLGWHERFGHDPGLVWLRGIFRRAVEQVVRP